jgi:hypothetical protein
MPTPERVSRKVIRKDGRKRIRLPAIAARPVYGQQDPARSKRPERTMKRMLIALLACVSPLLAQAGGWQYSVSPYLWLPTISLDSSSVGDGGSPVDGSRLDIGPTDYLDALNFALMLSGDMRRDDWVIMADLIYLDFGIDDKDIDLGRPGTGPIAGSYGADLSGSVITLAAGKTFVRNDRYYMDGLAGWRRFGMTFDLAGDLVSGGNIDISKDLEFNDAFVAVNGRYLFGDGDRWSLRYYADIGTGESDMTWQALLGLGYGFGWGDLFVDYRHLDYDFGDVTRLDDVASVFSGPSVGATFRFGSSE